MFRYFRKCDDPDFCDNALESARNLIGMCAPRAVIVFKDVDGTPGKPWVQIARPCLRDAAAGVGRRNEHDNRDTFRIFLALEMNTGSLSGAAISSGSL